MICRHRRKEYGAVIVVRTESSLPHGLVGNSAVLVDIDGLNRGRVRVDNLDRPCAALSCGNGSRYGRRSRNGHWIGCRIDNSHGS